MQVKVNRLGPRAVECLLVEESHVTGCIFAQEGSMTLMSVRRVTTPEGEAPQLRQDPQGQWCVYGRRAEEWTQALQGGGA